MLKGIYAPIPTPFDKNGELNLKALKKNLEWWSSTSLEGLVIAGTNGEAVLLDHEEKVAMFAYVRENLTNQLHVIAGTGCESARATKRLNKAAAESGCDAALVINPAYFKGSLDDKTLENYFLHIAENSPLPVILYNMPRNTALNMSSALISKLAKHPNIVGIKDSSGNIVQISEIIHNTPQDFAIFAGSTSFLLPSLVLGAAGGTLALANIMPEQCVRVMTLFEQGKLIEAKKLQLALLEINHAVTARWGISALKAALDLMGLYGGAPRLPLLPLGSVEKKLLKKMMENHNLL
jgi:4-hydroxy-2-oxoglutarate aldolase